MSSDKEVRLGWSRVYFGYGVSCFAANKSWQFIGVSGTTSLVQDGIPAMPTTSHI